MRAFIRAALVMIAAVLGVVAGLAGTGVAQAAGTSVSFTARGCTTWAVPAGVSSVQVQATGAAGGAGVGTGRPGGAGGLGDGVSGTLPGLAGGSQVLDICVGQGGGAGGDANSGSGGGASGVSLGSDFSSPVLVAGGGGGGSADNAPPFVTATANGGNAGQPVAQNGSDGDLAGTGGGGGSNTTMTGGAAGVNSGNGACDGTAGGQSTAAGPGAGGAGSSTSCGSSGSAGGGGGYFGGGGGAAAGVGGGGGGGTDFCAASVTGCALSPGAGTQTAAGSATGDAQVTITYAPPAPAGTTTASLADSGGNPIAGAAVTFRSAGGSVTNATTGSDGTASVTLTPGSYAVTMYYATGYQTKTLSVTASGPNTVSFATIAVTAQINDPNPADLAAAQVAHAGNTGTFGPKTAVDGTTGQVVFQVLPGTNTFTGWDAGGYQTQTVTVTGPATVTFNTVPVTVQINDPNGVDLAAAQVAHAGNTGTFGPKTAVDPGSGQVVFQVLPGTNYFTAWDAGGYQTQKVTVTGSATVTFNTVPVTVTVLKNGSPLTTALVAHAGNTGSFGPKTAVDGNGQVIVQVLAGTNYFTAWDGSAYTKQTLTVTGATSTSISVT